MSAEVLNVQIEPWGPGPELNEELARTLPEHPTLREVFGESRHRLLRVEWLEPELAHGAKRRRPLPAETFRATFYNYTRNNAVVAVGSLENRDALNIEDVGLQPQPSEDEFDAAVQLVIEEEELGPALREGMLQPYRPMPPLVLNELPDGRSERVLAVGLLPVNSDLRHEIVGVNMNRGVVERYEGGASPFARADRETCEPPPSADQATATSAAGQVWVTVRQGRTVLWRFLAVRPAASSGTNGSGIELRYLDYRGKRVLYRAHVPILNVRYDRPPCGPYRDWQNQEGMLEAHGTDVAPGFRLCSSPARTILDTGSDSGNFLGVAIYVQGLEVVLVSEMQAGWYRYVSEWRLHVDGTIRPRFGFAGVQNSCTCQAHHHHVYWRLDFDIRSAGNNVVDEFNDPPLFSSNWHRKGYEIRRSNDPSRKRRWRVSNRDSGEAYTLIPGPNDGLADSFGVGDLWILRYRGTELDDGQDFTMDPVLARANLHKFLNGENIEGKDVVLWYAAHFMHDGHAGSHIVGPDLVSSDW
jgi:hypothetical protein